LMRGDATPASTMTKRPIALSACCFRASYD
jgi:hypothetical protein